MDTKPLTNIPEAATFGTSRICKDDVISYDNRCISTCKSTSHLALRISSPVLKYVRSLQWGTHGPLADGGRPPLKVAEVLQHPKFGHTKLELVPDQKGKVPVARDRGGPIDIAYEVHGNGPRYLVV